MSTKKVIILVTNGIYQDKRMEKIAKVWEELGCKVSIWGRKTVNDNPPNLGSIETHYLSLFYKKGILFYLNYFIASTIKLLFSPVDIIYCVDADTLLTGVICKHLRGKKMVFDSHEIFHEVPELSNKRIKKYIWKKVSSIGTKTSDLRFTVGESIATELKSLFKSDFYPIKNTSKMRPQKERDNYANKILVYQGMLNKGRGLEHAISALIDLPDWKLYIIGRGDIQEDLKLLADNIGVDKRVIFTGFLSHEESRSYLEKATLGVNLLESKSLSYYHSLANKTFDYMHQSIPAIHMAFPEYININKRYNSFILLEELNSNLLVGAITKIDHSQYQRLQECNLKASREYNWTNESQKLKSYISSSGIV